MKSMSDFVTMLFYILYTCIEKEGRKNPGKETNYN